MTDYVQGTHRNQTILLPDTLDDYVLPGSAVRFIDSFVDSLNLVTLGFTHSELKDTGRPPFNPADMLKLYLYGYLNQVRTSRKLERECQRNLEAIWLMRRLTPDYKTIADFRRDNVDCVKSVFRELNRLGESLGLFEGKLVAVDGTKLKAVNSNDRNVNKKKIEEREKPIDKKIDRYLKELDENDAKEEGELQWPSEIPDLKEKIKKLEELKKTYKGLKWKMESTGATELSLTDPDSRTMQNNGKFDVCYNGQIAVDSKEKLVVAYDVNNKASDRQMLADMSLQAKEALGVEELEVVADKGFHSASELERCLDHGITPFVPKPDHDAGGAKIHGASPEFSKDKFVYDSSTDTYRCPAGQRLTFWREVHVTSASRPEGWDTRYYTTKACRICPHHLNGCTTNRDGRIITRGEFAETIERTDALRETPEGRAKVELRKTIVEHPFGTIKRGFNQGYLLRKGRRKAKGEVGLTWIAYNMRRMINIVGVEGLTRATRQPA